MSNLSQYVGNQGTSNPANAIRSPSPYLWGDCPEEAIRAGLVKGVHFFDDFDRMPLIGTQTTQIGYSRGKVFATSGAAVTPVSAVNSVEVGGGILAMTHAADNDSASYADAYPAFDALVNGGKLWFEARVAVKSLTTLHNGFFIGLAETNLFTLATGVPLNGNAVAPTADGSMLGFSKPEIAPATAGALNTVYTDRATSYSAIGTGESVISAVYTFVKLGMKYDSGNPTKAVRFFTDGLENASYMTPAQLTATTNLKAKSLGVLLTSIAAASVSTDATYIDWVKCIQQST